MKLNKENYRLKLVTTVLLIVFSVVYLVKASVLLDPDFGWGLRLGEIILKSGFPTGDPFSYTMPNYNYADHEWLLHVIIAFLFPMIGYLGLALIFTALGIATVVIVSNLSSRFKLLQILIVSSVLLTFFGIRPQVITWLFFAALAKYFLNKVWQSRLRFFMPVIFLIWANLHGGFVIGLIVLLFVVLKSKKFSDLAILSVSIAFTLVNPYGIRLWLEIWNSIIDPRIRFFIFEWRPLLFSISSMTLFSLAYYWAFFLHHKKKYGKYETLLFIFLFLSAFSSARNIPLFIIYAGIMVGKDVDNFSELANSGKLIAKRFRVFFTGCFALVLLLVMIQLWGDYQAVRERSEDRHYPRKAVVYLSRHLPKGQIFSSYEWGGYLDWKLPQKKVFIDGRMASWRQNRQELQQDYVFEEYVNLLQLKLPLEKVFAKYSINTVLLPRAWFFDRNDQVTFALSGKFLDELKKNGFKKTYADSTALIFTKKIPLSTEGK